jgi:DNA-binding transcriptional LysR family regulator
MVSLVLEEGLSNEVVARFNNDQMDVAFVRARQIHADGVVVIPLQEEPMVVALPSRHPMARSRRSKIVPLKSLVSDPFILIGPPGTGLHDETVAAAEPLALLHGSVSRRRELRRPLAWSRLGSASPWCRRRCRACVSPGSSIGAYRGPRRRHFSIGLATKRPVAGA